MNCLSALRRVCAFVPLLVPLLSCQTGRVTEARPAAVAGSCPVMVDTPALDPRILRELVFTQELGEADGRLHVWRAPPKLYLVGTYDAADSADVAAVVAELNTIAGVEVMRMGTGRGEVSVRFGDSRDIVRLGGRAAKGNWGISYLWWDADGALERGAVVILKGLQYLPRRRILREEIGQVLGVLADGRIDSASMFYAGWTRAVEYSPSDTAIIRFLGSARPWIGLRFAEVWRRASSGRCAG